MSHPDPQKTYDDETIETGGRRITGKWAKEGKYTENEADEDRQKMGIWECTELIKKLPEAELRQMYEFVGGLLEDDEEEQERIDEELLTEDEKADIF